MPLFGHRDHLRRLQEFGVPGLSDVAVGQGWEPLSGPPFGGLLEADVRDITLALYGAAAGAEASGAGPTEFTDAYRGQLEDRAVIVANAWTRVGGRSAVAVCAVELACPVARLSVQPRQLPPLLNLPEAPVGRRAFDDRFLVQATPDGPVQQVLTPEAQQHMLARDDWFFRAGRGLLGCVGREPFRSVDEVSQRISAVLALAAAMSAAPVMSAPVTPPPPVPVSPVPGSPVPASPVPGRLSPSRSPLRRRSRRPRSRRRRLPPIAGAWLCGSCPARARRRLPWPPVPRLPGRRAWPPAA